MPLFTAVLVSCPEQGYGARARGNGVGQGLMVMAQRKKKEEGHRQRHATRAPTMHGLRACGKGMGQRHEVRVGSIIIALFVD